MEMETQKSITEWSREQFGYQSPLSIALRMNVEVGELLNVLGNRAAAIEQGNYTKDTMDELLRHGQDEVADVGVMLLQVAEGLGIDLLEAVTQKMGRNRKRSWAQKSDGSFQHVEGT
jgi:NTP pyrophosphatase (non-canonical NTP hydrolase)